MPKPVNREVVACVCWQGDPDDPLYLIVKTGAGRWTFPKGGVDDDEEPRVAACRETREEAGVGVEAESKPFTNYLFDKKEGEQMVIAYLARLDLLAEQTVAKKEVKWRNFDWTVAYLARKRKPKYVAEHVRVLRLASQRLKRVTNTASADAGP